MNDEKFRALKYALIGVIPREDFGGEIQMLNWLILYKFLERTPPDHNNQFRIVVKTAFSVAFGEHTVIFKHGETYDITATLHVLGNGYI